MHARPLVRGLIALAVGVLLGSNVRAQDTATAGALFEKGVADLEAKRFESACPVIQESHRIDPRPGTLFTLAECLAQWGKVASAVARYQDYVDLVPLLLPDQQVRHRSRLATARARLKQLRPTVPTLALVLPPNAPPGTTVTRNGEALGGAALGLALPVDPGSYTIVTRAPGAADQTVNVTLQLGEAKRLELELGAPAREPAASAVPVAPPAPEAPPPPPPSTGSAREPAPPPEPASKPEHAGRRTAAYVAAGVGVAGVAVGVVTGILVLGKKSVVSDNCPNGACNDEGWSALQSGKRFGLASTIAFGVGVAGLVLGGVLLFTGSDAAPTERGAATGWGPAVIAGAGAYGGGLQRRF